MPATDTSARALGLLSLGLGAAELLAPRGIQHLTGAPSGPVSDATVRLAGARELGAGAGLLAPTSPTPWLWTRMAGDAMDLALLGSWMASARKHRVRLAVAAGTVAGIAAVDFIAARRASRASEDESGAGHVVKALTIRRSPEEVYRFWRDFRNLPRFTSHLESVAVMDDRHSHWTAQGPAGRLIEWDAEVTEDRPNRSIGWRSVPGAGVETAGTVRFAPAPGARGTEVRVEMTYRAPGGALGTTLARFFGQAPSQQLQSDLRKLKQVLETGEVIVSSATTEGTSLFQKPAQPSPRTTGARP